MVTVVYRCGAFFFVDRVSMCRPICCTTAALIWMSIVPHDFLVKPVLQREYRQPFCRYDNVRMRYGFFHGAVLTRAQYANCYPISNHCQCRRNGIGSAHGKHVKTPIAVENLLGTLELITHWVS